MKEFRTEIKVTPAPAPMGIKTAVLTQGSCFADAIGNRLATYKINSMVNPFGVIYNPESIHKVLAYAIFNESLPQHTYLHVNEVHLNYNFHSQFSALRRDELAARLMNTIGATHYFLKDAEWLLITYGTAWVYQRNETGEIVANCHKLPSDMFTRSLLSTEGIVSSFETFYRQLRKFNPEIKIMLTVSPVRHIKETLELNSVSKSTLRVACHHIDNQFPDVEYFPAYEMMLDDLRDYRFYKADMLHPTLEAEDYIWEKFMERYFSPDLKTFVHKWNIILTAMRHRPFHPDTAAHRQFVHNTLKKLEDLKQEVNTEQEVAFFKQQLTKISGS
jgi:hypothetical protein